jgi:NADPH:quinone reductase-like Zn-dependent oxidoreductase/malonyl CoA-acyl carrier protein transacylase/NADP-dependent 3-hydroxy acid dehydrogenase YdfG/acyl carrier protein
MAQDLLEDADFAACIAAIDEHFEPLTGYRLAEELRGVYGATRFTETQFAQPAIFAVQCGMVARLRALGLAPAAVVGHSVGEVAAAWAAGILDLADAVCVIVSRSRLQERTRGQGQMTAVALDGDTLQASLQEQGLGEDIQIAAWNSPRGATVVGHAPALEHLERRLKDQAVLFKRLDLDYPFHGPAMDTLKAPLRAALRDITPHSGTIPFFSTVTASRLDGRVLDGDYWWRNVRAPVRFAAAITEAHALSTVFLEVGAHTVLGGYLKDLIGADHEGRVLGTLKRDETAARAALDRAAARLWITGSPLVAEAFFAQPGRAIALPPYPWEHVPYWHAITAESSGLLYRYQSHPLLGAPVADQEDQWEQRLNRETLAFLNDHRVGDAVVFPAAGFVEVVLAMGRARWATAEVPVPALRLESLDILQPLVLEAGISRMLRSSWHDDGSIELRSRQELERSWTVHVKARVSRATRRIPVDLPGPGAHACTTPAEAHYAHTRAAGLDYGPAFQTLVAVSADPENAEGDLRLANGCDHNDYLLHPTLLDGALQMAAELLQENGLAEPGWGFVPTRVESLEFWPDAKPVARARIHRLRRHRHSLSMSLGLYDADGVLCCQAAVVRLRRLRLQLPEAARMQALVERWLPQRPHREPARSPARLREALEELWQRPGGLWQRFRDEYLPLAEVYLELAPIETDASSDADLWQTLLQDYPDCLPLTFLLGRLFLRTRGQGESLVPESAWRECRDELRHFGSHDLATALAPILQGFLTENPDAVVAEYGHATPALLPLIAEETRDAPWRLIHIAPQGLDEDPHEAPWRMASLGGAAATLGPLDVLVCWSATACADSSKDLPGLWERLRPGGHLLTVDWDEAYWQALLGLSPAEPDTVIPHAGSLDTIAHWSTPGGPRLRLLRKGEASTFTPHEPPSRAGWIALTGPGAPHDLATLLADVSGAPPLALEDWLRQSPDRDRLSAKMAELAGIVIGLARPEGRGATAPTPALLPTLMALKVLGAAAHKAPTPPRLRVLLQGDHAPGDTNPATPWAYAVNGFLRTVANEWPSLDWQVHWVTIGTLAHAALRAEIFATDSKEPECFWDADGRRLVRRVAHHREPEAVCDRDLPRRLDFSAPGPLNHLAWYPWTPETTDLSPREVEVQVHAAGLNFRDLMYALGALPDEALENGFSGPGLGLEFAGVVRRVGEAVSRVRPGERVWGVAPHSLATYVRTTAEALAPIPKGVDFAGAATLATVFVTAWYALIDLAQLKAGERVLIHGGTGGVGLAAIQIARHIGAQVLALAGSPLKRDLLRLVGVEHVYDSRQADFAETIRADGLDVDVVLNSVSGDAIRQNLALLRPFGRFLELGKRDFYADSPMGLRPFRNNLSYFGVDADQLFALHPQRLQQLFGECLKAFSEEALHPLPYRLFPAHEIHAAFRSMQQSRHIGKVVIDVRHALHPRARPLRRNDAPALTLDPEAWYVITGGLSGLGLAAALGLAGAGARRLALVSRSGLCRADDQATLETLRASVSELRLAACDVGDRLALQSLIVDLAQSGPLRGLIHAAGVIEDAMAEHLDGAQIERVLRPKTDGAWNLHLLTQGMPLDFFVLFSSITTLIGNPGQAHYVAANAYLEGLAHWRRQNGLPGTALGWGAIGDTGYLHRHAETRARLERHSGVRALSSRAVIATLLRLLAQGDHPPVIHVADVQWARLYHVLPAVHTARFGALLPPLPADATRDGEDDIETLLQTLNEADAKAALVRWLRESLGPILHLAADKIPVDQSLAQLGLDSLMAMEMTLVLEDRLGFKLPAFWLGDGPSLQVLAERLWDRRQRTPHDEPLDESAALARKHGATDSPEPYVPERARCGT